MYTNLPTYGSKFNSLLIQWYTNNKYTFGHWRPAPSTTNIVIMITMEENNTYSCKKIYNNSIYQIAWSLLFLFFIMTFDLVILFVRNSLAIDRKLRTNWFVNNLSSEMETAYSHSVNIKLIFAFPMSEQQLTATNTT